MIRLLRFRLTLILLLATTFCIAQKRELKFSKDGKFKIVQFTDVHFKYGNPASDVALERINKYLMPNGRIWLSLPEMLSMQHLPIPVCGRSCNK